ncbi:hypothetical protein TDB9533_03495 [Thalassocella blandensis]|nr:hypothetical protein TDB9533_03495 [Thalassocella blandensis]
MVIASMTTLPSRAHKIHKTIDSIKNQTHPPEYLQLNLPINCIRDPSPYILPNFLINDPFVKINWVEHDLGPVTKILPTLEAHRSNSALDFIISIDDDIIYPEYWFSSLLDEITPNSVTCGKLAMFYQREGKFGLKCNATPSSESVFQILQGFTAIAYPAAIIDDDFFAYVHDVINDQNARYSDDLFISYYLYQKNIPIFHNKTQFRSSLRELQYANYGFDQFALHKQGEQNTNHAPKYFRALSACKNWFKKHGLNTKELHMEVC